MTQFCWHVARATGLVAWLFGAASMLTGITLASRAAIGLRRSNWQLDLHRIESAITVGALTLHVTAIIADSYVHIGPLDVLLPGHSSWRTGAVASGIVALYLTVVVELTSVGRRRISKRWWHRIHLLSIGAFGASTVHAFTAGTDTTRLPALVTGVAVTTVVIPAIAIRVGSALVSIAAPHNRTSPSKSPQPRP